LFCVRVGLCSSRLFAAQEAIEALCCLLLRDKSRSYEGGNLKKAGEHVGRSYAGGFSVLGVE